MENVLPSIVCVNVFVCVANSSVFDVVGNVIVVLCCGIFVFRVVVKLVLPLNSLVDRLVNSYVLPIFTASI